MPYLNLLKMSRHSLQDQTNIPLIVTTNDAGSARSSSLESYSFKAKSCRSFVRQQKLNNEHRNKSVPHNLQVVCPSLYYCYPVNELSEIADTIVHVFMEPLTRRCNYSLFAYFKRIRMSELFKSHKNFIMIHETLYAFVRR